MEFTYDESSESYVPAIPCPFYMWQFWKWQMVRCQCGKMFLSRDLSLIPKEYAAHYVLTHIAPLEPEPLEIEE